MQKNNKKTLNRILEIDKEIKKLELEKAKLSGIAKVPNRLWTNTFDTGTNDYDEKFEEVDWESTEQVLAVLDIVEKSASELRELIKDSTRISWYGPYHKGEE